MIILDEPYISNLLVETINKNKIDVLNNEFSATYSVNTNQLINQEQAIIEYNSYYKRINGDFLASFTYVPGTVLQLGYGSVWGKRIYEDNRNIISDQFINKERSLFLKASYRIRF